MHSVSLFTATLAAVAIAAAPAAVAAPSGPPCKPAGAGATICQGPGHVHVAATPIIKAPPAHQFNGWIGMVHHP